MLAFKVRFSNINNYHQNKNMEQGLKDKSNDKRQPSTGSQSSEQIQKSLKKDQHDPVKAQHPIFIHQNNIMPGIYTKKQGMSKQSQIQLTKRSDLALEKWKLKFHLIIEIIKGFQGNPHKVIIQPQKIEYNSEAVNIYFEKKKFNPYIIKQGILEITLNITIQNGFQRKLFSASCDYADGFPLQKLIVLEKDDHLLSFMVKSFHDKYTIDFSKFQCPSKSILSVYELRNQLLNKSQKLNKIQNLRELKGIYYELSKENMGSRILQKLLNKCSEEEYFVFFHQIKSNLTKMIQDKYGNYVFQKIVELSSHQTKHDIILMIKSDFCQLIKTKQGTFSMQEFLKILNHECLSLVASYTINQIVQLCTNQHSSHFIKKLCSFTKDVNFYSSIIDIAHELYNNKFGVLILQSLMKIVANNYLLRVHILNKIYSILDKVLVDEYGHYLVEELFKTYQPNELQAVFNYLIHNIVPISSNNYSSGVVKKALQLYKEMFSGPLIMKIVTNYEVQSMMESKSGSFVLHRLLDFSHDNTNDMLSKSLIDSVLGVHSYEQRNKWKKFLGL